MVWAFENRVLPCEAGYIRNHFTLSVLPCVTNGEHQLLSTREILAKNGCVEWGFAIAPGPVDVAIVLPLISTTFDTLYQYVMISWLMKRVVVFWWCTTVGVCRITALELMSTRLGV